MASFLDKLFARSVAVRIFGLGSIAIGMVGLLWGDFLAVWQPVPKLLPGRTALAYVVAAVFLLAGVSLQFRRTARAAALTLTVLFSLGVVLLHLPILIAHPTVFVMWSGTAEQLALVAGGLMAYAFCLARADRAARMARLIFGVCLIAFALAHLFYLKATADFVPAWIPPGQVFWAYATAAGHLAAAFAMLSGIAVRLAARLLTAMFIGFGVLVHAPLIFADPHLHFNWASNAMNFALIGAAWLMAASVGQPPARSPLHSPSAET